MYRVIIPELVTFDTNIKTIRGCYLIRRLGFFPDTSQPARHHYKVKITSAIKFPKTYDFRNGYYAYAAGKWYYERRIFWLLRLKFSYDPTTHSFSFNRQYSFVPLEIGGILPVGKLIADIIGLDLALAGFSVMRGFAFKLNDSVTCAVAPSFNGKTSLMNRILSGGGEYIAEDILVIKDNLVYPTAAIAYNYGRKINSAVEKSAKRSRLLQPQPISKLTYFHNATAAHTKVIPAQPADYISLNSLTLTDNKFLRSFIFVHGLTKKVQQAVESTKDNVPTSEILSIENFDFSDLFHADQKKTNQLHWDELGNRYQDVWDSPGKSWLSRQELQFVTTHLKNSQRTLDVGIGNGRILEAILASTTSTSIYGTDVAPAMVQYCQEKFAKEARIKTIETCNLPDQDLPFSSDFDGISCVRVLKYNPDWAAMITKLSGYMKPKAVLVFSVANQNSINRWSRYPIPTFKTTRSEIKRLAARLNLEIIEMSGFTRIPDKIYEYSSSSFLHQCIIAAEKTLSFILGRSLLTRELFVAVEKK